MAFLKSIILLVFFIHWVKAAQLQNDIDTEFNRIFHQIRLSMDNAWRWMREAANKSFLRMNEIFMARKPYEQGQHKYEDVIAPNDALTKSANAPVPLITSPDPQQPLISVTSAEPELATTPQDTNSINPKESANLPNKSQEIITQNNQPDKSQETVTPNNQPETANLQKSKENEPQNETKVSEQPTEQTEPEYEDDTNQTPATVTNGQVDAQTQTESEIPLEGEHNANKLELPAVQDIVAGDSPAIENVSESDDKMKIVESIEDKEEEPKKIVADPTENIEIEVKRSLSKSIYEQQNIIILFLLFLIMIMSAYFFLLARTPHTCPTIVIQELGVGGNSKPDMHNMHNIKK